MLNSEPRRNVGLRFRLLMADADAKLADIELPPPAPVILPFVVPPQSMGFR